MSKIWAVLPMVTMIVVFLTTAACGNKGELYHESDAAALEELEQAAEKLKKTKKDSAKDPDKDSDKDSLQESVQPSGN